LLKSYASGRIIQPLIKHYEPLNDGEMKLVIDQLEVKYIMTTETDLINQVSSELLSVRDILNDIEPN
jgi:hypothetical protein